MEIAGRAIAQFPVCSPPRFGVRHDLDAGVRENHCSVADIEGIWLLLCRHRPDHKPLVASDGGHTGQSRRCQAFAAGEPLSTACSSTQLLYWSLQAVLPAQSSPGVTATASDLRQRMTNHRPLHSSGRNFRVKECGVNAGTSIRRFGAQSKTMAIHHRRRSYDHCFAGDDGRSGRQSPSRRRRPTGRRIK